MLDNIKEVMDAMPSTTKLARVKRMISHHFDENGSFSYYLVYQTLGNEPVGLVTVKHMVWAEIKAQIKWWRMAQKTEDKVTLRQVSSRLAFLLWWLKCHCLMNRTGMKDYAQAAHTSQFFKSCMHEEEKNGILTRAVAEKAVRLDVYRAQHMFLNIGWFDPNPATQDSTEAVQRLNCFYGDEIPEDIELSLRNADTFASTMIDAGRFCQELTIDAAKNATMVRVILGDKMGKLHQKSRIDEDKKKPYGARYEFKTGEVKANHNTPRSVMVERGNEKSYRISDFFDVQRINALFIPNAYKEAVMGMKQEVSESLHKRFEADAASYPVVIPMLQLLTQFYHTLNDSENRALQKIEGYGVSKEMLNGYKRLSSKRRKVAFKALANQIRAIQHDVWNAKLQKRQDISSVEMVSIVLALTFRLMGKEANRPSSFANIVFEEEFVLFIVDLYKGDENVPKESRDRLEGCDAEDGTVVEIQDNHVKSGRGFLKEGHIPDGEYTIHREGNSAYACRSIEETIKARIPSYEESSKSLVFCTIGKEGSLEELQAQLVSAKKVVLVPLIRKGLVDQNDYHDIVVADGQIVANFQNKVGGKADSFINGFYEYKTGRVTFAREVTWNQNSKEWHTLFVVLGDVRKSNLQEFKKEFNALKVADVYTEPTKAVVTQVPEATEEPRHEEETANPLEGMSIEDIISMGEAISKDEQQTTTTSATSAEDNKAEDMLQQWLMN